MTSKVEYGENPVPVSMPKMKGLFVGGCVERGVGSSFRRLAHTHCGTQDPYRGWVCVRSPKRVYTPSGKPSNLMWHEYAHVVTNAGHTERYFQVLLSFGQKAEVARLRKRNAHRAARRGA